MAGRGRLGSQLPAKGRLTDGKGGDAGNVIRSSLNGLQAGAQKALLRAAVILVAETKQLLLTPGRGRVYRRRGITHQASAPGEPPAPDIGTLQRSIDFEVVSDTKVRVGTNVEYASPLEFGSLRRKGLRKPAAGRGRTGSQLGAIAPRPFMRPAFTRAREKMDAAVIAELKQSTGALASG